MEFIMENYNIHKFKKDYENLNKNLINLKRFNKKIY